MILCNTAWPTARAQAWPSRPLKLVVNLPPGGASDQFARARALAPPLQEALGQRIVVENKAGSGGTLGGAAVAKAAADGYTLLMTSGGMLSVTPHLYDKLPFDPVKDLVPVAAVVRVAVFLVVPANSPYRDWPAFLADLKLHPGRRSYGSPGNGSAPNLAAELMKSLTGTQAMHVPYRGAAPALNDLLGGQLDFLFDPGIALPHIRSGRLRLLAVGSAQRAALFPDVPTLAERGLPGFDAGTPPVVVQRLGETVARIVATPALRERIAALGGEPALLNAAEFSARMAADGRRFGALIRERRIVGD
ncbi:MAG: tripartite tricarboxylate transporter substrate binding protein [Betaproteobacteria bacterium]|nr:tripartite tricarboxylate transporter substrate binding protein [Betaproteobacteria bacterium]